MITVRKGDTIYALSRRYDVTVREIIRANHLKVPYLLYPGQRLKSPGTAIHKVKKGDTVYSLSRKYRVDMTSLVRLNHLKRPYMLSLGQKLKVPRTIVSARKKYIPPPPPQSGKGFMWPVKGRLLSSFGPKAKGYHNDGINIAAKSGSYVRAAESGVVVHAGSKIKGFGKLILIRHSNGWVTAYAHNSSILIKTGQAIKRGQAIARVGTSGGVDRPQLHFEMRKGARAVNPVKYLS
ncbi:MAG: M23 family metallopeptidase [Emcibacter sp.]|nr:M23 family metallopeptidase [Emcibacter sp.]